MPGSDENRTVEYELHIEDAQGWVLQSFKATEALNEPYEMTLVVHVDDDDADPRSLVGRNVELLIDRRSHNRRHCGVIRRVEEGSHRGHRVTATLTVVPALWSLGQGSASCIFQERTVKQILEAVLSAALSPFGRQVDVAGLQHDYPTREYCVQYRESPLGFCQRLMEEEGIGYYFDFDADDWERLVLFERNGQLEPTPLLIDGPVPFHAGAAVVHASEPIVELAASRQLVVTQVHVTDFDWTQSTTPIESTEGGSDERVSHEHGHGNNISHYDFSEGARYGQNDVSRQGQIRREAHARDADTLAGVSMVTGFAPGRTFEVSGHPVPGVDGEYLVTGVVHFNQAHDEASGENYHNRFQCIPLDVPWRPRRSGPRPAVYGVQTAMVTGGSNGEIITDAYGRVRVQFHWDREPDSQRTSCWVRVAQTWGGHDGMGHTGFLFIPRVGMECIVTFIDGDPDRPLITGSVYNGTNLPPIGLPEQATRSVIRTRSTGGTGYNELSFEDAAGTEEVHIHAEKNMREIVKHDHLTSVHHDQKIEVDNDQFSHVKGNQYIQVDLDRVDVVDQNERRRVRQNRELEVDGLHEVTVHGEQLVEIDQREQIQVHGGREIIIDQGLTQNVTSGGVVMAVQAGGLSETVTGGVERIVMDGGLHTSAIGGTTETSIGDRTVTVNGDSAHTASGDVTIEGGNLITLRAQGKLLIDAPMGIDKIGLGYNTEHRTNFDLACEAISEVIHGVKSSVTLLSMSETGIKIGQTGVSMSSTELKIDRTVFKSSQCDTANIDLSTLTIIG